MRDSPSFPTRYITACKLLRKSQSGRRGARGPRGGWKETYMDYDTCVQFVMKQQSSLDLCNSLILQCQVKGGGEGTRFSLSSFQLDNFIILVDRMNSPNSLDATVVFTLLLKAGLCVGICLQYLEAIVCFKSTKAAIWM